MMYHLEKNSRGMITNQVRNGEAGNIYANRKEINKQALKNLKKNTPSGKLGKLGDTQIFNFSLESFVAGNGNAVFVEYNEVATGDQACDEAIMFTNGKSGDGLYYNILDVKCQVATSNGQKLDILNDSYVEFYLLQNSASPIGKKIPRSQVLFNSFSATGSITTTGAKEGNQYIASNIVSDNQVIPTNSLGLRASGLAFKTIYLNLGSVEDRSVIILNFVIYVDNSSVSRSF